MAQADIFDDINPVTTSGSELANILNVFKATLLSGLRGTARPDELTRGGMWVDTSDLGSNEIHLMIYDGSVDLEICTVNVSTHVITGLGGGGGFYDEISSSPDSYWSFGDSVCGEIAELEVPEDGDYEFEAKMIVYQLPTATTEGTVLLGIDDTISDVVPPATDIARAYMAQVNNSPLYYVTLNTGRVRYTGMTAGQKRYLKGRVDNAQANTKLLAYTFKVYKVG